MSHWVILLLALYVALGLSRMSTAKATRVAVVVTTLVVSVVLVRT
jgi:hypothetical protein